MRCGMCRSPITRTRTILTQSVEVVETERIEVAFGRLRNLPKTLIRSLLTETCLRPLINDMGRGKVGKALCSCLH